MKVTSPYSPKLFQHEADRNLMSDVMEQDVVNTLADWLKEQRIEEAYQSVYQTSFLELNEETSLEIFSLLCRASKLFGLAEPPKLYLTRDSEKTVELWGFSQPIIVLSDSFLSRLDEKMLFGILAGQTAGIRVNHHRGLMLSWLLDTGMSFLPLPAAVTGSIGALLNQWKRHRVYTCDRGFLLAVADYGLALRSVLTHMCSKPVLDALALGTLEDRYRPLVREFLDRSDLDDIIDQVNSLTSDTAWLPQRIHELEQFYLNNREVWE